MSRIRPLPGEVASESIAGYGLGLRSAYRDNVNFRLDLGRVYQGGGLQNPGDTRLHGVVSMFF